MSIKSVCVYCGSSNTVPEHFKQLAAAVSTAVAKAHLGVVYGGGHVGLMGIVADTALKAGTTVIGIIPEHIRALEIQHNGLTELHVVPDMHTRKRMMVDLADAFVILPGGFGTLDEFFEILTWKKLKLHNKPIIVFNDHGFWDNLVKLVDGLISDRFANPADRTSFAIVSSIDEMMDCLRNAPAPNSHVAVDKL